MNMMHYKNYYGTVEYDQEDHILYGKLAFIRDLVNYEAENVKDLELAFQSAVDDYLETCEQLEKTPDKPFKGTFNVRAGHELHEKAAIAASKMGIKLNDFVKQALSEKISHQL